MHVESSKNLLMALLLKIPPPPPPDGQRVLPIFGAFGAESLLTGQTEESQPEQVA